MNEGMYGTLCEHYKYKTKPVTPLLQNPNAGRVIRANVNDSRSVRRKGDGVDRCLMRFQFCNSLPESTSRIRTLSRHTVAIFVPSGDHSADHMLRILGAPGPCPVSTITDGLLPETCAVFVFVDCSQPTNNRQANAMGTMCFMVVIQNKSRNGAQRNDSQRLDCSVDII